MAKKRLPASPPNNLLIDQYGMELSGGVNRLAMRFRPQAVKLQTALSAGKSIPSVSTHDTFPVNPERVATKFVTRAVNNAKKTFEQNVKSATGKAIKLNQKRIDKLTKSYIKENVSLIQSIPVKLQGQMRKLVDEASANFRSSEALAEDIARRFEVTESRAQFIARDQLSKLTADMNKLGQQDIGVELYYWRTENDDRVRDLPDDNHRAMEGMLCRWDDPSVFSVDDGVTWQPRSYIGGPDLEPGQDYNCRCVAEGVVPDRNVIAEASTRTGQEEDTGDLLSQLSGFIGSPDIELPSAFTEYAPPVKIKPTHPPTHLPTHLPSNRRSMTR